MKKKKSSLEIPEELDNYVIASLITKSMEITRDLLHKFVGIPSIKESIFVLVEQQAIFRTMNSDVNNTVCKPDVLTHMKLWISQLEHVKRCESLPKASMKRISMLLQFYTGLCHRLKHEQAENRNQYDVARQLVTMKTKEHSFP